MKAQALAWLPKEMRFDPPVDAVPEAGEGADVYDVEALTDETGDEKPIADAA